MTYNYAEKMKENRDAWKQMGFKPTQVYAEPASALLLRGVSSLLQADALQARLDSGDTMAEEIMANRTAKTGLDVVAMYDASEEDTGKPKKLASMALQCMRDARKASKEAAIAMQNNDFDTMRRAYAHEYVACAYARAYVTLAKVYREMGGLPEWIDIKV